MNRAKTGLLLVLLIQCGIIASLYWPVQSPRTGSTGQGLAAFSIDTIDELRIGDEFDNEAILVRSGEQWLLPDLENLPADPLRVHALLQSITGQPGNWPIAHSPAARQRFQVADYYYQRRLTLLSSGKNVATLYLGTSPGFRKVHARNDSQSAIYGITLDTVAASAVSANWLEPRLLQVRAPLRIDADLYNLHFENGVWRSGTGGVPDERELETLITALRTLQVDGVADEDLQRELFTAEADLVLNVESLAGEMTLELITLGNQHFIHSSEYPLFFTLSAYDFDRLMGIDFRLVSGEESRQ